LSRGQNSEVGIRNAEGGIRPPACRGNRGLRPGGKSENEILKAEFGPVVVPEGRDYAAASMWKWEKGIYRNLPLNTDVTMHLFIDNVSVSANWSYTEFSLG